MYITDYAREPANSPMNEFIRGGFNAVMRERNNQEKLELNAAGYLPPALRDIVLGYSYISDSCLDMDAFGGKKFWSCGAMIKDVKFVAPTYSRLLPSFIFRAKRGDQCNAYNSCLHIKNWMSCEVSIVILLEMILSRNCSQTMTEYTQHHRIDAINTFIDSFSIAALIEIIA